METKFRFFFLSYQEPSFSFQKKVLIWKKIFFASNFFLLYLKFFSGDSWLQEITFLNYKPSSLIGNWLFYSIFTFFYKLLLNNGF